MLSIFSIFSLFKIIFTISFVSSKLGVIISTILNNLFTKKSFVSSFIKEFPLVAIITGSRTIFFTLYFNNFSYITSPFSLLFNIPIFTAETSITSNIASICFSNISIETSSSIFTFCGFCAVKLVITVIP